MIQANFGQSIQPQGCGERTGDASESLMNLTDRVTIVGPPDWRPLRRAPQLVGMPAFANVRDEQAGLFHNGRPIRPLELVGCSDLGLG